MFSVVGNDKEFSVVEQEMQTIAINIYFNTCNKHGIDTFITWDPVSYFATFPI